MEEKATDAAQSSTPPSMPASDDGLKQSQMPAFPGFPAIQNSNFPLVPVMYPALLPGFVPPQVQEQANNGPGIYAVPVMPFMGPVAGLPINNLIPLTYNIPVRPAAPEGGAASGEHGQEGRQQPQAPQRQIVVRRLQLAFQLDLLLLIKLAAVVFVFNQDGSRQRLILLLFLALLVYLYQTGSLTPLIRWLTQGMHRAAAPPQPRAVVRAENGGPPARPEDENAPRPEHPGAENHPVADGNQQALQNENAQDLGRHDGINWWGIVKEIQIIVVGFITSLLPGIHNVE